MNVIVRACGTRVVIVARSTAKATMTPRQLDALRHLRARLQLRLLLAAGAAPPRPAEVATAVGGREAGVHRSHELLALAQGQRDDARDQLREARRQRDEARTQLRELRQKRDAVRQDRTSSPADRRSLQELVLTAQRQRNEVRERVAENRQEHGRARQAVRITQLQRDEAKDELRTARQQRDRAASDRTSLREQRDSLRAELDIVANPDLAAEEHFARLRQHRPWRPGARPAVELRQMGYGPVGPQNPVLSLLYSRCLEQGVTPVPLRRIHLDRQPDLAPGSILNLHWTRFVQVGCTIADEAEARTQQLLDTLSGLRDDGVRLVWTIHEELPHDCPFPEIETKLRSRLADLASTVHVLHPSTVAAVEPYYTLDPEKVLVVEHPLYTGIYPDYVTRSAARAAMGLDDDELTVLLFGAIRPYKGIDRMLAAVSELRRRRPERRVRVIIAGPTFNSVDSTQLVLRARSTPGVTIEPRAIHSQHVQHLFRAADLVAMPYTGFLNSGVLLLALTFGRPVLAPDSPVTRDMLDSGLVRLFDQTHEDAFGQELQRAVCDPDWLPRGPLDETFAARHDPVHLAGRFAERLVAMNPEDR